ncbi:MAG: helix-hairpin-helix domain-containing protein [Chthoniobacteraceae bacterium]
MSRVFSILLAGLLPLPGPASAAGPSKWEVWEDCRFDAEKYYDGDSFHIRHGRKSVIVRLYFVDTPETDTSYAERIVEQAAYFRASKGAVLRAADAAKEFTAKFLAKPFRVITCRRVAPGASRSDRYYAIVERDGVRLDAALVEAGWARVTSEVAAYPDEAGGRRVFQQLRTIEQTAARARRGLWAASGAPAEPMTDAIKPRLGKPASADAAGRVNLNTATQAAIETLPGVGPKMAEQIIRARPLSGIEAFDAIPGVGPKMIEAVRDLISF